MKNGICVVGREAPRALAALALAVCTASSVLAADAVSLAERKATPAESLEIVVPSAERMLRWRLAVDVDGTPLASAWHADKFFAQLLDLCDSDGDGALGGAEIARLPSPFALRQALWIPGPLPAGRSQDLQALANSSDARVGPAELAEFYRRAGLGLPQVAVGKTPASGTLSAALFALWDADQNGRVTDVELAAAEQLLERCDRNGDELLGPEDLLPGVSYPGITGSRLLHAPSPTDRIDGKEPSPVVVLPQEAANTAWAAVLVAQRDRDADGQLAADEAGLDNETFQQLDADTDKKLSSAQLASWRNLPQDAWCRVRLGDRSTDLPIVECAPVSATSMVQEDQWRWHGPRLHLTLSTDEGRLPAAVKAARARYEGMFAAADADGDGSVAASQLPDRLQGEFKPVIAQADRDNNGSLSRDEFDRWLGFSERLSQIHVLLTVLDHGPGLFEFADIDRDGALSRRELRRARARLVSEDCLVEGRLDLARLPSQFALIVSRGHPRSPLPGSRHRGPEWFLAMDRNRDGDVSLNEYFGSAPSFRLADVDGDQLLSADESSNVGGQ